MKKALFQGEDSCRFLCSTVSPRHFSSLLSSGRLHSGPPASGTRFSTGEELQPLGEIMRVKVGIRSLGRILFVGLSLPMAGGWLLLTLLGLDVFFLLDAVGCRSCLTTRRILDLRFLLFFTLCITVFTALFLLLGSLLYDRLGGRARRFPLGRCGLCGRDPSNKSESSPAARRKSATTRFSSETGSRPERRIPTMRAPARHAPQTGFPKNTLQSEQAMQLKPKH